MEWISHTTTGFFLGQLLVKEEDRPRRAGWWWAVASISPDWLEWGTRWFGDIHRGVTHSLYVWPLLALGWALAARRWGRLASGDAVNLLKLWGVFFIVIGSHLLLDVLMNYRWYPAWPFSDTTWAWGIMPLFDVYIFAGWLALWLLTRKLKLSSATTAKLGLAIFLAMFAARSAGKVRAQILAASSPTLTAAVEVHTRPTYYTPWLWLVRNGDRDASWSVVNVVTGEFLEGYTRGRGFPPVPGRELIKLPTR